MSVQSEIPASKTYESTANAEHYGDETHNERALVEALIHTIELNLASRDLLRLCADQSEDLALAANFRNLSGQRQRQAKELLQYVPGALGERAMRGEADQFLQLYPHLLEGQDPQALEDKLGLLLRTEQIFSEAIQRTIEVAGDHGITSVLKRHLRNAQTLRARIQGLHTRIEA